MSARPRDGTSVIRHTGPACVLCGRELVRRPTGRRRLYCGAACRQQAYRLRAQARHSRDTTDEVSRILASLLQGKRRGSGLT